MFVPRPDAPLSAAECWDFVRAQGFGHLVAPGAGRELPVVAASQYVVDGGTDPIRVLVHLARPNPLWAAIDERPLVLLSVAGDWAYVPGGWKAIGDEEPGGGVPTTYYAAVQIEADAEVVEEPAAVLDLLRRQLATLDPDLPDPAQHEHRLPAIRGLVLWPRAVRGKFKYGGNVDVEHRLAVAERLRRRGGPGDGAARAHLFRRLGDAAGRSDPSDQPQP